MRLDCYKIHEWAPTIVPGQGRREWMDAFQDRHPYRCLPLTMANCSGWEILCPIGLTIEWDGGLMEENIRITGDEPWPPVKNVADSHFRRGIVTFHTGHLFRTDPGWSVWTMGPPNEPKDGIYPLQGVVETEWLPFPFTMNWQMTRPGKVRFEKALEALHRVRPPERAEVGLAQPEHREHLARGRGGHRAQDRHRLVRTPGHDQRGGVLQPDQRVLG